MRPVLPSSSRVESLPLATLLVLVAVLMVLTDVLSRWDLNIYDIGLRLLQRPAPNSITVVSIDEESISTLGRWPWPRKLHGQLIDRLAAANARAVGFDILFDQNDPTDIAGDFAFGAAARKFGKVALATAPVPGRDTGIYAALPMPALEGATIGHVDVELDQDGIARQIYLHGGVGSARWPALGLAIKDLGEQVGSLPQVPDAKSRAELGATSAWVRAEPYRIPFYGGASAIPHVSYARLLRGDPDAIERVRGKFVVVGVTAIGLSSGFVTPGSAHREMPGVELTANVLGSLLEGVRILQMPVWAKVLLSALLAVVPIALFARARTWSLAAYFGWLVAILVVSAAMLYLAHTWFPPASALAAAALSYPLWSWGRLNASLSALTLERNLARATLHSIGDAVVTTAKDGRVDYLNPVAETMTGISLARARGKPLEDVVRTFDQNGQRVVPPPVKECLVEGKAVHASQYLLLRGESEERTISWNANPIRDSSGAVQGLVLAFADVTRVLALTREMVRQATHDGLTDLPNRVLLEDRLATALPRAHRADEQVAVMFIDLDGFKKINDGLGHAAGDQLLREVAQRLKESCREEDSVARWGGDEFIVVLERLHSRDIAASRASQLIQSLAQPFSLAGQEVSVTISIGISFFPKDGKDAATLLKRADAAMYRAKEEGRNGFRFYSARMSARARERLSVEKSLRDAMGNGEFVLHYQPQIELGTGRIRGLEALLRWNHPQQFLLTPAHFLSVAEQSQLIHALGDWAMRTAFKQLADLQRGGLHDLQMSVNLSPRQLVKRDLYARISQGLEESGVDPSQIALEISEELLLKEPNELAPVLNSLRDLGVRIAIDDFGTGHSSIGYLKRLPIDQLKIDQTFVRDAPESPKDAALVQGMVTLARSLNLEVIAEGVESERELSFVRDVDCDAAQGFYLGAPKGIEALLPLLPGGAPPLATA